jgi:hypothetical protein
MRHRGVLTGQGADACALRMARHLAYVASERGMLTELPDVIRSYAARCHVSARTAWTDLDRLVRLGLVRQVQAAAPGYTARYRLSAPAAAIAESMPDLPGELARAITPPSSCGRLHTSPSTREGSPPSPGGTGRAGQHRAPRHRAGRISGEERDRALSVLSACRRSWLADRGPHGVPGPAELARIEVMTALALRHVPPGEVRQLLTHRVAGARDLPGVLAWRLGKVISAARRPPRHVPADEHGTRHAAMLAERAAHGPGPAGRAAIAAARAALTAAP